MKSEVYNIDCLEYMRGLPDKHFDLVIADPPYGGAKQTVARTGGTWASKYGTKINKWDQAPTNEWFEQISRVSKNQIIWGANYFTMPPTRCFIVWKKHIPENFTMAMCEYAWTSFNSNAKVFEYTSVSKKEEQKFHPTQKPIALYAWLLSTYGGGVQNNIRPDDGQSVITDSRVEIGFRLCGLRIRQRVF